MSGDDAARDRGVVRRALLSLLRRHTIVALLLLLFASSPASSWPRPGTVSPIWLSNTLLFAAPLGIIAAGQTLVMLTGGIDLSVASVATGSAYLMATIRRLAAASAVLDRTGLGLVVGLINGVGIALLRVQPLVMTLGTGLMTEGMLVVYSQKMMASAPACPTSSTLLAPASSWRLLPIDLFLWAPIAVVIILVLAPHRLRPPALCDRRQSRGLRARRHPRLAGAAGRLCRLRRARRRRRAGARRRHQRRRSQPRRGLSAAVDRRGDHWRHLDLRRSRRLCRQIVGALILTVLNSMLTLLDVPEPVRQILYGAIILLLAAAYTRLTD